MKRSLASTTIERDQITSFQGVNGEKWDDISIVCPYGCACQYTHMNDLSVTRWINGMSGIKDSETFYTAEETNDVKKFFCKRVITDLCFNKRFF